MQKTDFQRTGYLSRKSDNGTWSNRYISLSTDTGAMKFYVEKSGKKTMKSQVNIKKGKFLPLTAEAAGKPFAFQLIMEELVGKSDDANLTLAAPDENQYNEWVDDITSCFSITDARRRKSALVTAPETPAPAPVPAPVTAPAPVAAPVAAPVVAPTPAAAPVAAPVSVPAPAPVVVSEPSPAKPATATSAPTPKSEPVAKSAQVIVESPPSPAPAKPETPPNPLISELKLVQKRKSISNLTAAYEASLSPKSSPKEQIDIQPLGNSPTKSPNAPQHRLSRTESKLAIEPIALPPRPAPFERTPSKEEKREGTPKRYETIEVIVTSDSEDGMSVKKSSKYSSRANSPPKVEEIIAPVNPELEEKLEKLGKRKSYKPPKKLGNLLNSKGLTPEMEEEIKKVKEGGGPSDEKKNEEIEGIALVEEPPAPKPRQLVISVRPTSPIREGYLFKFENSMKEDIGEDPWIQQFASLEIATGILQFYSELGGRRIARGKINILDSTVEPIDLVFHARLYAFRLNTGPDKVVSTLAAEDLETFSYWLISFDDCFKHVEELKEKQLREEEEKRELEMQRMQLAQSMARSRSGSEIGPQGNNSLERKSSFRNADGSNNHGGIERKTSFREGTLERKGSLRLDHLEQHITQHEPSTDKDMLKDRLNDSVVTAKAVNHNYFEDPTPLSRPPSFKLKEATFAADDSTINRSRSFTTGGSGGNGLGNIGPIIQLNEKNSIDDLLRFDPDNNGRLSRENSATGRSRRDSEHEMMEIKTMEFSLKKSTYPADRLARRVKIWYCSGGFSLSTEDEINQFVDALKNTDDPTLKAFSEEKFEHIHDWSNLLEVLRKYEQKILAEMANNDAAIDNAASNQNHVKFVYEITVPSRNKDEEKVEFEFSDDFDFEALVKKLNEVFGYSELALMACVPPLLANKENPWSKGLVTVKEDLLFAEDLVLYQEEVIEHMWDSYSALKQMIEQKDEVINQLYNQMSDLQDKVTQSQSVQHTLFSGGLGAASSYYSMKNNKQSTKELQVIADREFYAADKDGDGRISREEWRNWIQDKHNLVQEHNEVKTVLMNEIKNLRKAMNPQQEQLYNDLKKSDDIRKKQEEELVQVHIENDKLKAEVSLLQQRLKELAEEKEMVESDLKEKMDNLQKQLDTAININNAVAAEQRYGASDAATKEISAASNLIDSPYAYNYALDRSTGIAPKRRDQRQQQPVSSVEDLDLLALASMNEKFVGYEAAVGASNDFLQNPLHSQSSSTLNVPPNTNNNNNKPWQLEAYPGEMSRLGVDSSLPQPPQHLVNVYPQTLALRSPDEEDYYNQMRGGPTTAQNYLNNLQENQQYGRNGSRGGDPNRFPFDDGSNNNNRTGSSGRRPISPSVVQSTLASVYDHPLRNALRQETKPSFMSAPSPYTSVRNKVSTTNYNHTINSKMKPTKLKTGTVIGDRVVANPSASLGPRNGSPTRMRPPNQAREDTIYEYSSRLPPSSNAQTTGDRSNSPSRFMLNTNSWKQKINTPHQQPDAIIRAGNWKL